MKNLITPTLAGLIGGLVLMTAPAAEAQTTTLIPLNGTWKYLDTGVDPGSTWTSQSFNDVAWKTGAAERLRDSSRSISCRRTLAQPRTEPSIAR